MRDIHFRAWDKEKNIWIEGAYGFHILGESMLLGGLFQNYKLPKLNNIILMQYTGLKDKNTKEIYEGDIVKSGKYIWSVQYNTNFAQFCVGTHHNIWMKTKDGLEIIGNIWENKELLNDEEN